MSSIDVAEAFLVDIGDVHLVWHNIAVKSEWWSGGRVGKSTAWWRGLGKDSNRMAKGALRAVGGGAGKKGGSGRELDVDR
jgi:hypothetical protein